MRESETFGIETKFAERAIEWMNEQAKKNNWKFEAKTYNSEIKTKNGQTGRNDQNLMFYQDLLP